MNNKYEVVIGLEIHIELATASKMFCACSADYFGKNPNTHTCPICLGLPGAMPVVNLKAIEYAQKLGLALNCESQMSTKFDRKNYFYPDLAKGFQISQYDLPFSQNGFMVIKAETGEKKIGITRAHLEEDTGKLSHAEVDGSPSSPQGTAGKKVTLIDFNRSGVPLVEVVSEPDMHSAAEAKTYAQKLQQIVRYLGISDADMEKGSMRIEPNVSLRKKGETKLPNYKVELKNINSFRFAEKAINFEIERQSKLLDAGKTPAQETRGWNEAKNETVSQRSKEEAHDYRYFPEPDIPPFVFKQDYILMLKSSLPELPDKKLERFQKEYQLSGYDAEILTRDVALAAYFEEAAKAGLEVSLSAKQVANVLINRKPDLDKILPATLVKNIHASTQTVHMDEKELAKIIDEVLAENQKAKEDVKKGKVNAVMFLVGQVLRKVGTQADANRVKFLLEEKINV